MAYLYRIDKTFLPPPNTFGYNLFPFFRKPNKNAATDSILIGVFRCGDDRTGPAGIVLETKRMSSTIAFLASSNRKRTIDENNDL